MPSASVAALVAALLYIAASLLQARRAANRSDNSQMAVYSLSIIAVVLHGYAAASAMVADDGYSFSLFHAGSLIFWMVNVSLLVSLLWRPLQNLMVVLFPLSALSVMLSALLPSEGTLLTNLSGGMLAHIGTSILAYAVLVIAAVQAGAVAAQDYQLRHRQTRGLVQLLPPLQLMENMLFEIVWIGLVLLTVSIGSGFIFVNDFFAQHLVHKTVLSICAWLLFATLLWGRHALGWRSQVAARFTLGGFVALALAYAGSKFVLELVLQRT